MENMSHKVLFQEGTTRAHVSKIKVQQYLTSGIHTRFLGPSGLYSVAYLAHAFHSTYNLSRRFRSALLHYCCALVDGPMVLASLVCWDLFCTCGCMFISGLS